MVIFFKVVLPVRLCLRLVRQPSIGAKCFLLGNKQRVLFTANRYFTNTEMKTETNEEYRTRTAFNHLGRLFEEHLSKTYFTDEEWETFKENVLSKTGMNEAAFDSLMMRYLGSKKCYKLGHSLINFIRKKNRPNFMTLANYISLCGITLGESTEEEVLATFHEMHPNALLHKNVATPVVHGLAQTSHWNLCLKIIQDFTTPNQSIWSSIASAAFRSGDHETAWKLLNELVEYNISPSDEVFIKFVQLAAMQNDTKTLLSKMLHFCRSNRVLISKTCASEIKEVVSEKLSLDANFVTIESETCCNCNGCLDRNDLTTSELEHLQQKVKTNVMLGSNIFLKSTPSEVSCFLTFIDNIQPYDIVIDGLNVAMNHKSQIFKKSKHVSNLLTVVNHFDKGKKIIIIGRKHMLNWSRKEMAVIMKRAACFFAENISKDDPFFLYAALIGGPNTLFVSNDIMKDHRYLLDKNDRVLFDRWRFSRQILLS